MRARTIPVSPKEEIVRLEYEPGRTFCIHLAVGKDEGGVFVPMADNVIHPIMISGDELTLLEENQQIQNAIGVIMGHAWTKVDQKRGME